MSPPSVEGTGGKGVVKLGWVSTAELNKQSGLNCTGRGPSFTGRATAGSMVRKRNMRRKPLYLDGQLSQIGWDGRTMLPEPARF